MKLNISPIGAIVGLLFWVASSIVAVNRFACLERRLSCQEIDLLLAAIIGVALLVPAFFLAAMLCGKGKGV